MPLFLTVTTPSSREAHPSLPTATRVALGSRPPPDEASLPPACGSCNHNRNNFKFKGTPSLKSTAFDPKLNRLNVTFSCLNAELSCYVYVETILSHPLARVPGEGNFSTIYTYCNQQLYSFKHSLSTTTTFMRQIFQYTLALF